MKYPVDINNWSRKETHEYFKVFDNPYFNICTNIDVTYAYNVCRENGYSINHMLHYECLRAVNLVEEFKFRYIEDNVVRFDRVNGGATVLLEDKSIRFCFYELSATYEDFVRIALENERAVKATLQSDSRTLAPDIIHFSVLPWTSFTSISHPRHYAVKNGIPKITFGKFLDERERKLMPLSVEADHSLMDGYHVCEFINSFRDYKILCVSRPSNCLR